MFLQLNHQKLEIYKLSKQFVLHCYKLTKKFPIEEKYAMSQQIRRAGLSVHLNLAEGFSRRSGVERKRFFEVSRGSIIEIDAALDIALELDYATLVEMDGLGICGKDCFKMLSSLINKSTT
jgi:four helix bundle protein